MLNRPQKYYRNARHLDYVAWAEECDREDTAVAWFIFFITMLAILAAVATAVL